MTRRDTAMRSEPRQPEEDYDLVGQYLKQISATPLLSAAEEVELARRIEAGVYAAELLESGGGAASRAELEALVRDGQRAKDHMIRANLRLVVSAARRYYRNTGLSFLDVVQEGNLGLIRAVDKFDYAKGFKFSTYAMWWIRQAIERGKAERARTIRLPVHVLESITKLGRVERKLQVALGRTPTAAEVAAESELTEERVIELRRISRDTVSLDTPVGDEGSASIGDLIEDTEVLQASDVAEYHALAQEIRALVDTLPPREALIITLRYGLNDGREHTLQEVAERVGLTKERVRQLEKQSLAELRDPQRREPLLEWAS
ncbi:sigma-70 family RNA polymerase sigma factor [Jiangella rhizosphaerae]|uniref:RNA polymerase sigma factor n=1 Tax=Jiangella rhizosphaerae TaxID=2293569 RepID=A0A418KST7_9ACTN|nr:sigma-70 family RNA polymerase sigma factor [Jiangella rhizosphaerae]RIQ27126.1 sigma-70 family RNA polymerase sigma factor [Jiangella rhizosphaerae]